MSAESLHASARNLLSRWSTNDPAEDSLRHTVLAFLDSAENGCLRENVAGHITASSLVLDEGGCHVLLTLHPRVGRWIQLGGHCEVDDDTVIDAALREAAEESGIPDLTIDPELLSLHTHPITCSLGQPTRHLDLRFLVRARDGSHIVRSDESTDLRWWPVDQLPADAEADTLGAMIRRAATREPARLPVGSHP